MLRSAMPMVATMAFLIACGGADEAEEAEGTTGEIDTAAMIAEGAASSQGPVDDPSLVPVEIRYNARLLVPAEQAAAANLSPGGEFSASGKGRCQLDERAGTWRVELVDIDNGNLRSFQAYRWKPEANPHVSNFLSAGQGDMQLFNAANDGKDFLDKIVANATRTGDGATVQFDVETTLRGYAIKGTATCAKLSPPVQ